MEMSRCRVLLSFSMVLRLPVCSAIQISPAVNHMPIGKVTQNSAFTPVEADVQMISNDRCKGTGIEVLGLFQIGLVYVAIFGSDFRRIFGTA